jgi:hypothetical protein
MLDPIARTDRRNAERRRRPELRIEVDPEFDGQGERRCGERRRQIDPTTCERDYSIDEVEFMTAIDRYRREAGRPFPTWSEVLEVVRSLGYSKVVFARESELAPTGV